MSDSPKEDLEEMDSAEPQNSDGLQQSYTDPSHNDTVGGGTDDYTKRKEHTRSAMALLFALGFFALLLLCFVYGINTNASLSELKEALVAIIGSLSGILGFIVGYYYKSSQEQ